MENSDSCFDIIQLALKRLESESDIKTFEKNKNKIETLFEDAFE
jgi:hypothetical protein